MAFAQLAEAYRHAGSFGEAVDICRVGLSVHPGYLSARVTLGRALLELDRLDEAETELRLVLESAPENLSAIRGLGDIEQRRGHPAEALVRYRAALSLAPTDSELRLIVKRVSHELGVPLSVDSPQPPAPRSSPAAGDAPGERAKKMIAALERFLTAIHGPRTL